MAKQRNDSGNKGGSDKGRSNQGSQQNGNNSPKPKANENFKGVGRPPKPKKR